jgi:hypothetical protein
MGGLRARKALILAKTESSYSVDPSAAGVDAFQVSNLSVDPLTGSTVERDYIKPYFGQAERLMSEIYSKISFEVEAAGHGAYVVGAMPKLDRLLKACAMSGTQGTQVITSITRSGTTATATIGAHAYPVGAKIAISGCVQPEYNITATIIAKTGTTFDFTVSGSPASPATGSPIMNTAYSYAPITDNISSLYFVFNVDGTQQKLAGARGTVSLDLSVKNIPKFKFEFTGLNVNPPVDAAAATPDFTAFTIPQVANTQNTTNYSLLGYAGVLESLSLGWNNEHSYITLIGQESVEILNRKISGQISILAPTMAQKDYFSAVKNQTTGALTLTHGSTPGNIVDISCPRVMLDSPKYKEANGLMMLTAGIAVMPTSGNDEIAINFK